jgi:hypothetical protein
LRKNFMAPICRCVGVLSAVSEVKDRKSSMPPLIRQAMPEDAARIGAIARAAYAKYVPRIGREPAPMVADFAAEVAAGRVVVIGTAGAVDGYMIAWPETDAYFIENIGSTRRGRAKVSGASSWIMPSARPSAVACRRYGSTPTRR